MNLNQTNVVDCEKLDSGDTVFVLYNTVLLLFMLPGFSFFYSGLTHPGSSLTILMTSALALVIVSIQWWLIGYSLSFSLTAGPVVGDFSKVLLTGVYNCPYPLAKQIPELVFCFYQCVTAVLPAAILLGAIAERGQLIPALLFICLWTTFVYDVICYWSLNPRGWSFRMGLLDYGGASPVHVPSAAAALAYSTALGPLTRPTDFQKPQSMNYVIMGTSLIWIGSYGNVAAMRTDMTSILSVHTLTLAASGAAITWGIMDYLKHGKLTAIALCCGAVAGSVSITPCAGFVSPGFSILIGSTSGLFCNIASQVRDKYQLNDVLEVFVLHGVSGVIGAILTGVFSQKFYGGEMIEIGGGWQDGNWKQMGIQLVDLVASSLWSFIFSYAVLFLWNKTSVLKMRVDVETELRGLDEVEVGIKSYETTFSSSGKF